MTQTPEPKSASASADTAVWIDPAKENVSLAGQLTDWIPLMQYAATQLGYRGEYLTAAQLYNASGELEHLLTALTAPHTPDVIPRVRLPLLKESTALLRVAALSFTWLGIVRNIPVLHTAADELQRLIGRYEEVIGERRCHGTSGSP